VVALLVWRPGPAHGSPEDLFSFGPQSPAMGGTGAAFSRGADAAYTNPALLALVHRDVLSLGLQGAAFHLSASGQGLPGLLPTRPARGYVVGLAVPMPFGGVLKDRVAAGMALYTPSDTLVRGVIPYPDTPDYPLIGDRAQSLTTRVAAGVDIGHGVRLGAGVAVLAELVGTIDLARSNGVVSSRIDDQLIATYAPEIGAAWDLPFDTAADGRARWRVGASWRGRLEAHFGVTIDASTLSSLNLPKFNIAGTAQYDPDEAVLELAREDDGWLLAAGVTWAHWSAYPGLYEATIVCSDSCGALTPPKPALSDTLVPRIGMQREFLLPHGMALRARTGAFFSPSPVPSSLPSSQAYGPSAQSLVDVPTRFFDAARFVWTVGGGVDLGAIAPVSLDVWAQVHFLVPTTVSTAPAGSAQLSGTILASGLLLGVGF
jgi:long-chain fatty acid transport protein